MRYNGVKSSACHFSAEWEDLSMAMPWRYIGQPLISTTSKVNTFYPKVKWEKIAFKVSILTAAQEHVGHFCSWYLMCNVWMIWTDRDESM